MIVQSTRISAIVFYDYSVYFSYSMQSYTSYFPVSLCIDYCVFVLCSIILFFIRPVHLLCQFVHDLVLIENSETQGRDYLEKGNCKKKGEVPSVRMPLRIIVVKRSSMEVFQIGVDTSILHRGNKGTSHEYNISIKGSPSSIGPCFKFVATIPPLYKYTRNSKEY